MYMLLNELSDISQELSLGMATIAAYMRPVPWLHYKSGSGIA